MIESDYYDIPTLRSSCERAFVDTIYAKSGVDAQILADAVATAYTTTPDSDPVLRNIARDALAAFMYRHKGSSIIRDLLMESPAIAVEVIERLAGPKDFCVNCGILNRGRCEVCGQACYTS